AGAPAQHRPTRRAQPGRCRGRRRGGRPGGQGEGGQRHRDPACGGGRARGRGRGMDRGRARRHRAAGGRPCRGSEGMNELLINAVGPLREWFYGLGELGPALWIVLKILTIAMPVIIAVAFYVVWERKLIGWMHVRHGPMYVGMGIFQAFADVFKLLFKEVIQPANAHKAMYVLAPLIVLAPAFAAWAVVPFDYQLVLSNANAGLLYLLAMTSMGVYGIIIAGWASNSKYAFLGAMRSAAQVVSYEIAMGFALVGVLIA